MKTFWKLVSANLKMTLRDRIAVFWMVLFPIMLMLVLGAIFGRSGEANLNVGVVDLDRSPASIAIVSAMEQVEAFTMKKGAEKELLEELEDAKLNAVLVISKGFMSDIESGRTGNATIYVDRSSITVAEVTSSALRQVMVEMAREISGGPELIKITEKPVTSDELKYVDFLVPGVLAITVMYSGLLGLSQETVIYREKGILRRIKVSPLRLRMFLAAGIAATLMLALGQAAILLLVGRLVFKVSIQGNLLSVAFLILLGATAFVALGFMVASLARTQRAAQMAGSAITMPMMMLAGVFFPLSIMPAFLVVVAKILPLYYLGDALRNVMIRGAGLGTVWLDVVILSGMTAACFAISIWKFKWE